MLELNKHQNMSGRNDLLLRDYVNLHRDDKIAILNRMLNFYDRQPLVLGNGIDGLEWYDEYRAIKVHFSFELERVENSR